MEAGDFRDLCKNLWTKEGEHLGDFPTVSWVLSGLPEESLAVPYFPTGEGGEVEFGLAFFGFVWVLHRAAWYSGQRRLTVPGKAGWKLLTTTEDDGRGEKRGTAGGMVGDALPGKVSIRPSRRGRRDGLLAEGTYLTACFRVRIC